MKIFKISVLILVVVVFVYANWNMEFDPNYPYQNWFLNGLMLFLVYPIILWVSPVWGLPKELQKVLDKYPETSVVFNFEYWRWRYIYSFCNKYGREESNETWNSDIIYHYREFYWVPTPWSKKRALMATLRYVGIESGMLSGDYPRIPKWDGMEPTKI